MIQIGLFQFLDKIDLYRNNGLEGSWVKYDSFVPRKFLQVKVCLVENNPN